MLREHVRMMHTHRDVKPYKCAYCDYRCRTSGNCRKHCVNRHKDQEVKWIKVCDKYPNNSKPILSVDKESQMAKGTYHSRIFPYVDSAELSGRETRVSVVAKTPAETKMAVLLPERPVQTLLPQSVISATPGEAPCEVQCEYVSHSLAPSQQIVNMQNAVTSTMITQLTGGAANTQSVQMVAPASLNMNIAMAAGSNQGQLLSQQQLTEAQYAMMTGATYSMHYQ